MEKKYEISVIVSNYNQNWQKVRKTLRSVIVQKNLLFEIIFTDDGSKTDYSDDVKALFSENEFSDYVVLRNETNLGTVRNILGALQVARGEYIFFISPGDFVYDDCSLSAFYRFAKDNKARFCFGNYLKYSYQNNQLKLYDDDYHPASPARYTKGLANTKVTFFLIEDNICGVAYLRERKLFTKALESICNYAVYMEDWTTSAWALLNNVDIIYFDRTVSWYEHGTGISTVYTEESNNKLRKDLESTFDYLYTLHSREAVIAIRKHQYIRLDFLLRYPVTAWRKNMLNKYPKRTVIITEDDRKKITALLEQ